MALPLKHSLPFLAGCLFANAVAADDTTPEWMDKLFMQGSAYGEFRYRYEYVDQVGFPADARSSTMRSRLGFKTGHYEGFQGAIEVEDVSHIGADEFNSATNGNTRYPVVADPDKTELNQLYAAFTGIDNTMVKVGRQYIALDNHRFIGNVNWRQNSQTFDAISVKHWGIPDTDLFYAYSHKANRLLSDDHPLGDFDGEIHMINAKYKPLKIGEIAAYGYLANIRNNSTFATNTFGGYLDGEQWLDDEISVFYRAEYANQRDAESNPANFNNHYGMLSAGLAGDYWSIRATYELLTADNGIGFATPFSTIHEFNGWADQFITTPGTGLEDKYIWFDYELHDIHDYVDGTVVKLRYHNFDSERGSIDYGDEFDFDITQHLYDRYEIGFRYAYYDADQFATDKQIAVLTLRYHFGDE